MSETLSTDVHHRIIEACDLVKIYRGRKVVNGVNIRVQQGEIVGLLGPNGAGKTTTFYMAVGLVRPNSGKIILDNKDITRLPMYRRARLGIAYLAQEASVFRKLTARENVLMVLELTGYPPNRRRARADELLADLHIQDRAETRGYALSGGERRRVEIARALAANPSFLLLDEPFAGVDPLATEDIQNIVRGLRDRNIGVLITDHNAQATLRLTDRTYILADGKVVTEGAADQIANDPLARKYYLGENFTL
ncbi:MAG: LPS export ABC transporter ATP-binding protein [bacterium]|jgi:lipopolysaccharide export system ATP-binding protein